MSNNGAEAEDLVWSLNLINGQVARIQRHVLEHSTFSVNQVEVAPFSESYDPDKWEPVSKDEWLAKHQSTELAGNVEDESGVDPEHPGQPEDENAGAVSTATDGNSGLFGISTNPIA